MHNIAKVNRACDHPDHLRWQARGVLKDVPVERATFVEVTKAAVLAALASPRDISAPLVCHPPAQPSTARVQV